MKAWLDLHVLPSLPYLCFQTDENVHRPPWCYRQCLDEPLFACSICINSWLQLSSKVPPTKHG